MPDQIAWHRWIRADLAAKRSDALLREYGSPAGTFAAGQSAWKRFDCTAKEIERLSLDEALSEAECDLLTDLDSEVVHAGGPGYPRLLKEAVGAPAAFYARGVMPSPDAVTVVVAGTRRASPLGLSAAEFFCRELARAGIVVASGGGHGIEAMAMRAAIDAGGQTVVIEPCGPDITYPEDHTRLFRSVAERGAVLSQFPMGTRPLSGNFQRRNRFLAALATAVLVLEAPRESGCLTTVNFANDDGRQVFVLPGPHNAQSFQGNHDLIRLGATLVTNPFQLLDDLGQSYERKSSAVEGPPLSSEQERLLQLFDTAPRRVDEIARTLGKPAPLVAADITYLELAGRVARVAGGAYCRRN